LLLLLLLLLLLSLLGARDELDLTSDSVWRLCDLLALALSFSVLGPLLLPRRYCSTGFRTIPEYAPMMSVLVPSSADVVPVTGSHRRFLIKIGFER